MAEAKVGDKVGVHYKGRLDDGEIFDSSEGQEPLEFVLGEQKVINGFDAGVLGMKVGEKKTLVIPPEEGYGSHDEEMVGKVERAKLPQDQVLEMGATYNLNTPEGSMLLRVISIEGESVTLDGNHPLVDKTLTFEVSLMSIKA